jgi:hypothetical protein
VSRFLSRCPSRCGLAAVAAAVIATAAACGSSPASSPASAHASNGRAANINPVPAPPKSAPAAKSGSSIIAAAVANTEAASTVRMAGAGSDAGKGVTFDLTLVRGQGCEGTLSMSKADTFQLVYLGQTVWMKPSDAFYASLGNNNKAALALLRGKYIKVKATNSLIGNISTLCTMSGLLGGVSRSSGAGYVASASTFNGQPAIKITQPAHPGYAIVSGTDKPVLWQVSVPGSAGGTITFSDYNAPARITAPPAGQTIDGSQLGL